MRLIDADALKQAVNERYHDPWIDMLIRNATTVDTVPAGAAVIVGTSLSIWKSECANGLRTSQFYR